MLQPTITKPSPVKIAENRPGAERLLVFLPYLIALFFALWGLRGVQTTDVVDTDAARHAMNGAFLRDLMQTPYLAHPIEYAKWYYAHLPALSMPYHPPLFPAIEALAFALLGINVFAARLVIAVATAAVAVLLYRLVWATHGSRMLALLSTVTFCSVPLAQTLANDVMLEMPTLAFVLAAIACLRGFEREYPLRRGLWFAAFAAAAIWTKQAVFLALIPPVLIAITGRWRRLREKTVWLVSAILGITTASLLALSMSLHWTGMNNTWPQRSVAQAVTGNSWVYIDSLRVQLGLVPSLIAGAGLLLVLVSYGVWRHRAAADYLYAAWILATIPVLLVLKAYDVRYLFFAYPAFIVLGYRILYRASAALVAARYAWCAPALLAAACVASYANAPGSRPAFLHGPSEVARTMAAGKVKRILYCGRSDGNFIFALRSQEPPESAIVIRGDRFTEAGFAPDAFEEFAHRYGLEYVVLERNSQKRPWDRLYDSPSPSLRLEREVPMSSTRTLLNGTLRVFRFTNPAPRPENEMTLRINVIGLDLGVKF